MKLLLSLCMAVMLMAGTYDEAYSLNDTNATQEENFNEFMQGEFEEIVRFDMLHFDTQMSDESLEYFEEVIIPKVKEYTDLGKNIRITLIGHTDSVTDDANEEAAQSDTIAKWFVNLFRYELDTNESMTLAQSYVRDVTELLEEYGIASTLLHTEVRGGKDLAYGVTTSQARELCNGVMMSLYVLEKEDIDSDKDGVFDSLDKCPNTPRGANVDTHGCPIDSDGDGVLDYKDKCAETPTGVQVDKTGCPVDSDGDGVVDYLDACADTPLGVAIDPKGCPVQKSLALEFASSSAKILKESHPQIQEFAAFLALYPTYKVAIIGHTDSSGKATTNMQLSQDRALAVKEALVAEGIDAARLSASGRGELDPIEDNRTPQGRMRNRRIEIELSY